MTPKEKAHDLYNSFWSYTGFIKKDTQECALVAADEVLNEAKLITDEQFYESRYNEAKLNKRLVFWLKVKREIKKL